MDLTVKIGDSKLNCRACVIVLSNNKILLHKGENKKHYSLPGGRITINESSKDAVIREFLEETGVQLKEVTFLSLIENFFAFDIEKVHEYCFIYKTDSINMNKEKFKSLDSGSTFEWFSLEEAKKMDIKPTLILKYLDKLDDIPSNIINKDSK